MARCQGCGEEHGFLGHLVGGGLCKVCHEGIRELRQEKEQLVESLEQGGATFCPQRHYRLGDAPPNRAVLSGLGEPPALPDFGLTFPRCCIRCTGTRDLSPCGMEQTGTRPYYISANFRDAELSGDFRVTVFVCQDCQGSVEVYRVKYPHPGDTEIRQRGSRDNPILKWFVHYSNFSSMSEFHEVVFQFRSTKYCRLFRSANRTKLLSQTIQERAEGLDVTGWSC